MRAEDARKLSDDYRKRIEEDKRQKYEKVAKEAGFRLASGVYDPLFLEIGNRANFGEKTTWVKRHPSDDYHDLVFKIAFESLGYTVSLDGDKITISWE